MGINAKKFFCLGSNSEQALDDMVSYAQETQHEKIIRGLAIGIALVRDNACYEVNLAKQCL